MDPKQVQQVTDNLAAQAETDKAERRYTETVCSAIIFAATAMWLAFLLWEEFRVSLLGKGFWWAPIMWTFVAALAAVWVAKYGRRPPD